jgi:hypothetical protein
MERTNDKISPVFRLYQLLSAVLLVMRAAGHIPVKRLSVLLGYILPALDGAIPSSQ